MLTLRYVTVRYVTDRHVRINVTLRFLTLRYVTWRWKTGLHGVHTTVIHLFRSLRTLSERVNFSLLIKTSCYHLYMLAMCNYLSSLCWSSGQWVDNSTGRWKFGTTLDFTQLYTVWRQSLLVEQSRLLTSDAACVVFRLRLWRMSRGLPPPTDAAYRTYRCYTGIKGIAPNDA